MYAPCAIVCPSVFGALSPTVVLHGHRRSENEKNRRRDLITALVSRREQMLLSLKRDHSSQQRCAPLPVGRSASPVERTRSVLQICNAFATASTNPAILTMLLLTPVCTIRRQSGAEWAGFPVTMHSNEQTPRTERHCWATRRGVQRRGRPRARRSWTTRAWCSCSETPCGNRTSRWSSWSSPSWAPGCAAATHVPVTNEELDAAFCWD